MARSTPSVEPRDLSGLSLRVARYHGGVRRTPGREFAFGRTLTPLVLLAALDGLNIRSLLPACGLLLIDPRVGLQFGPQVLNVVRGIFQSHFTAPQTPLAPLPPSSRTSYPSTPSPLMP